LFLLIVILGLLWVLINHVFIPKVLLPKVHQYIEADFTDPVKLVIQDISFNLFSGFQLENVTLSGPVVLKDKYILQAKLIEIDLDLFSLLTKTIEIKNFDMFDVDLNIGRDKEGKWNFEPLLRKDFMKKGSTGRFKFIIKKFQLVKGWVDYSDYFKEKNILERRFVNVVLDFRHQDGTYHLNLSGGAEDSKNESLMLNLTYCYLIESLEGTVKLHTIYLDGYWDYYLDDIFKPWSLQSRDINLNMQFSYNQNTLGLDGDYSIANGILSYGDLSIKGDARASHKQTHVKDAPGKGVTQINLSLENVTSLSGDYKFLDEGLCSAVITRSEVSIEKLIGKTKGHPIDLTGEFSFSDPRKLYLTGDIGSVRNTINLQLITLEKGKLNWEGVYKNSNLKIDADAIDLKNHLFDLKANGVLKFQDLFSYLNIDRKVGGKIDFSGKMKGETDKPDSFQGKMDMKINDFVFQDFNVNMLDLEGEVKDGIFYGEIPPTDFYKGSIYGFLKMNLERCGLELHIDGFNLKDYMKDEPHSEKAKGVITFNISFVGNLKEFKETLEGGGYFYLKNCYLWYVPLLEKTEEGIEESVTAEIDLPDFQKVEGNFSIQDKSINTENTVCKTSKLDLQIKGSVSFSGIADFTVGAKILGRGLFRAARQILVPITIGFDLLANCIQIKVYGPWKDLKHTAEIKPLNILTSLFPSMSKAAPDKYNLEKLWPNAE